MAADSSAKRYSLKEILERWKPQPLEQTIAAAEKGDVTAQHFLGYHHTEGLDGTTNYVEGRKWYLKAAEQSFPNSLNNLGVIYVRGRGVAKDTEKAMGYFKQAAELGVDSSQHTLARLILYGGNTKVGPEEQAEAFAWLRKAADAGYAESQALYGWVLMYPPAGGRGNGDEAISYLQKALAQGHSDAARWIGDIYLDKNYPGRDPAAAVKHYLLGAEKNQAASQAAMGWAYFKGLGVEQDVAKAIEWAQKAADQKYATAWYYLGLFHAGEGLTKRPPGFRPQYEKAMEYYEQAAAAGQGDAAYQLGKMIATGYPPGKKKEDALPILEKAAKQGHRRALELKEEIQMDLAANTKDETKVWEYLALFRNRDALMRLARKYRDGFGIKTDPVRTFRYEIMLHLIGNSATDSVFDQMKGITGTYNKRTDGTTTRIVGDREIKFTPIYQALEQALERDDTAYYQTQAKRYLDGGEMPKDIGEAAIWFQLAAQAGDASAKEQAAALEAQMDEMQRASVRAWVGWLKLYQKELR